MTHYAKSEPPSHRIPALTGRPYRIEPFDFDASADEWASKPGGPIPEWLSLPGDDEFLPVPPESG